MVKLPYRIVTLLNEHQVATIQNYLAGTDIAEALLSNIEKDISELDDEAATDFIIQNVIIPINGTRIKKEADDRIQNGGHTVFGVGGGDEEPPFAYSVGATYSVGFEVFVSGIAPSAMGGIINDVIDRAKEGVSLEVIANDLLMLSDGSKATAKLVRMKLTSDMVDNRLYGVKSHIEPCDYKDVVVVHLPDANSLFPGCEGYDEDFVQLNLDNVSED